MKRALLNSASVPPDITRPIGIMTTKTSDDRGWVLTVTGIPRDGWGCFIARDGELREPFPYIRLAEMGYDPETA